MVGRLKVISILASAFFAVAATAQAPAGAPAGSTGMCKDGSYWSGATKKGACSGHKGVQSWYGAGAAEATAPAAADTGTAAASKPAGAHASTPATAPAAAAGSAATADVAK
ncbi:MAG: DUF3761 domain-containing protein, partial [Pseudomonadota bacterium]|nr:DUF3761 domain-containing protein [Pseudomonadota bacterium]